MSITWRDVRQGDVLRFVSGNDYVVLRNSICQGNAYVTFLDLQNGRVLDSVPYLAHTRILSELLARNNA